MMKLEKLVQSLSFIAYLKTGLPLENFYLLPPRHLRLWMRNEMAHLVNFNEIGRLFYSMTIYARNYHKQEDARLFLLLRHLFYKAFKTFYASFEPFLLEQYFGIFSHYAIQRGKYLRPFPPSIAKYVPLHSSKILYVHEFLHLNELEKLMKQVAEEDIYKASNFICKSYIDLALQQRKRYVNRF